MILPDGSLEEKGLKDCAHVLVGIVSALGVGQKLSLCASHCSHGTFR